MKNTINILTLASRLLILTIPFVFTFCDDDDKGSDPEVAFAIDGVSQNVRGISGILRSEIQYNHEGRALNITAVTNDYKTLSVLVSNWDFQNPPDNGILTGEYDATFDYQRTDVENPFGDCLQLEGNVMLCDGGLVSLISASKFYTSVFDGNTEASITISKCDAPNRTVSGTFSAIISEFDGVEQFTISGSFTNVKYIVL